jgi:hypothetical protein
VITRASVSADTASAWAGLLWGLLSLVGFVVSGSMLAWPIEPLESLIGLSHVAALGLWAVITVLGGGLAALGSARLVFGRWPRLGLSDLVLLLSGALVSAIQIAVQAQWTMARFGYNDPSLVGPTYLLFLVVAGVAVAGFGVRLAPRSVLWSPLIGVFFGVAVATSVAFSNIHGLADGLAPGSGLLMASMVVSLFYVAAVGSLSIARLLHG